MNNLNQIKILLLIDFVIQFNYKNKGYIMNNKKYVLNNIRFKAVLEILLNNNNEIITDELFFDSMFLAEQEVIEKIITGKNQIQEYKDWVLREHCSLNEEIIYDREDFYCEHEAVDLVVHDIGAEHLKSFEEWLNMCDCYGYNITAEVS